MKPFIYPLALLILFSSCTSNGTKKPKFATTGSIERLNPKLDELIAADAQIEVLAQGFKWSEGPLWLADQNALIFSDVPNNTVYKWTEEDSISVYLKPSGYFGDKPLKEGGANGLALDGEGNLILCQHGERQLARMSSSTVTPKSEFETLASTYEGKRFNSPNDVAISTSGVFFFTDPPYGLGSAADRELDIQGVYSIKEGGEPILLVDSLSRPNGIALSPDEKILYVAVSDPRKAKYYAYDLDENLNVVSGKVLLDVTSLVSMDRMGLPDGLKIDTSGNLFATGPGGVLIISPDGEHLGTILTGQATANCGFNADKSVLYITAHSYLMRIRLKP